MSKGVYVGAKGSPYSAENFLEFFDVEDELISGTETFAYIDDSANTVKISAPYSDIITIFTAKRKITNFSIFCSFKKVLYICSPFQGIIGMWRRRGIP